MSSKDFSVNVNDSIIVEMNSLNKVDQCYLTFDQYQFLLKQQQQSKCHVNVNGSPLGLSSFALTLFLLSVFNAGSHLIDSNLEQVVLPVALFYGGIAQFAAGMWEFHLENTFAATAFTSYGAFWMSFAAYVYLIIPKLTLIGNVQKATGFYLLSWFIFTLYMNIAAYRISKHLFVLFLILNFTFLFLIIGNLTNQPIVINIGGWFGIVTAFIAWYGSAATMINLTWNKSFLPMGIYKLAK